MSEATHRCLDCGSFNVAEVAAPPAPELPDLKPGEHRGTDYGGDTDEMVAAREAAAYEDPTPQEEQS